MNKKVPSAAIHSLANKHVVVKIPQFPAREIWRVMNFFFLIFAVVAKQPTKTLLKVIS